MTEPNHRLRAARIRMDSPEAPGEPMSRQELADLVNAWVLEQTDRATAIDANYIGKLERGMIRWPFVLYREGLRAVLGAGNDRELGFRRPRRGVRTCEDVNRQEFLRTTAGVGALVAAGSIPDLAAASMPEVPGQVGRDEIDQVRIAARLFARMDHAHGGALVRQAAAGQLRYAVDLLSADCADGLRGQLLLAVGDLGHAAGFMAFDAYEHEDARRLFSLALACAEQAGDWHLRAKALSSLARQAIWRGDPDTGLTLIDIALVRRERLTPTERAMLLTDRARGAAKLGRVQDALRAVGEADEEFDRSEPGIDPDWMAYYDLPQHLGVTGLALFDVAVGQGRHTGEAFRRLAEAVAGLAAPHARSKIMGQAKLASLVMVTGDPVEAVTIGRAALDAAGAIRSRRVADFLRELGGFAGRHADLAEVADLRHRISTTVRPA